MEKLKDLVKKYRGWIQAGLIIVGLLITVWAAGRACRGEDKYSRLKGEYNILKKVADETAKNAIQKEKEFNRGIAAKDKEIVALRASSAQKQAKLTNLSGHLTTLEGQYGTLVGCDEKLVNMSAQLDITKQQYILAQQTIADRDSEILIWTQKYNAAVTLSETWKQAYNEEHAAAEGCKKSLSALEGKVGGLQFGSTVKNIVIGAAIGYFVYNTVKK